MHVLAAQNIPLILFDILEVDFWSFYDEFKLFKDIYFKGTSNNSIKLSYFIAPDGRELPFLNVSGQ